MVHTEGLLIGMATLATDRVITAGDLVALVGRERYERYRIEGRIRQRHDIGGVRLIQ